MPFIAEHHLEILKEKLANDFVPFLPPLLDKKKSSVEQDKKQLSRAFSAYILHKHLDLSINDACNSVVDDFDDNGIDAIFFLPPTLYCVQVKLKHKEQFKEEDALKFRNGVDLLLKQKYDDFNKNVSNRRDELDAAFDHASSIKLIVGFLGDGISEHARAILRTFLLDGVADEPRLESEWVEFNSDNTVEAMLEEKSVGRVDTVLVLEKLHSIHEPRATYYGIAKVKDLVELHKEHKKALYERNIRYFLGTKGSEVNRSIQSTLRDNPEEFFYLNNGVTALANIIERKGTQATPKLKVTGLSVINGAQTISSAAEFLKDNPGHDISNARVMLTIIKANTETDFGLAVTKARNHQNPVSTGSFAALDPVQEKLRRELDYLNYSYHYRPEALPMGAEKNDRVITIDLAMRALAIFGLDSRIPYWLKNESSRFQNIDSSEYTNLFGQGLMGSVLVNKVNCYRFIRDVLASNDAASQGPERLFYRHGAFLIASILAKRLKSIVTSPNVILKEQMNLLLSPVLDECRETCWEMSRGHVGTHNGVLAFFRNQGNTVALLERCMAEVYKLSDSPELVAIKSQYKATEAFPRERSIRFLVTNCPQI
jgi:hypothetical protein